MIAVAATDAFQLSTDLIEGDVNQAIRHVSHLAGGPASRTADFVDFLVCEGALDSQGRQRVNAAIEGMGHGIDTVLLELGLVEEPRLADLLSIFLGLPRVKTGDFPSELPTGDGIPLAFLRQAGVMPIAITPTSVTLAVSRPLNDDSARAIAYQLDRQPILQVATISELDRHLAGLLTEGGAAIGEATADQHIADEDAERLRDIASEAPVIRLFNRIVTAAIDRNASDIHIEPSEDQVRVRYRVDGALQNGDVLDRSVQLGLASRVKILARLNIAESRLPQDGRIRIAVRGRDIDMRVSTSPTLYGESLVLRILDRREVALDLAALGFDARARQRLEALCDQPHGIVLVTGPTGSGKTTTLYAALTLLNQPQYKLFTVEDPIEYHLKGVNQILVRPNIGLDFAAVLRSILRQDPDIIMIGEIRDAETAKIAIQASLTGHMVLSTLHTNSAVASVTRLRDIGVEDFLLVSSVRAIVAQRLVRRLCEACKQLADPAGAVPEGLIGFPIYDARGCTACHGTGYQGRTVIYEILPFNDAVKRAIMERQSEADIELIARRDGMMTLYESGIAKVKAGITSLDEVLRTVAGPGE